MVCAEELPEDAVARSTRLRCTQCAALASAYIVVNVCLVWHPVCTHYQAAPSVALALAMACPVHARPWWGAPVCAQGSADDHGRIAAPFKWIAAPTYAVNPFTTGLDLLDHPFFGLIFCSFVDFLGSLIECFCAPREVPQGRDRRGGAGTWRMAPPRVRRANAPQTASNRIKQH